MMPTLRQALLGVAFLIVYGAVVFAATRAYYLERAATPAPAATHASGGAARPIAIPQARPPMTLSDDPAVLADQADELLTQKRFGEAVGAYRKLLELAPDDVDTYNDLGLALHYAGRSGEALQVLESGTRKDAGFQRIWLTLGFVRLQLGQVDAARTALQACVDLDPDSAVAVEARRFLERMP